MNAIQHFAAINLSTVAALKSGECSLPEVIGNLELCKINVDRMDFAASHNPLADARQSARLLSESLSKLENNLTNH